MSEQYALKTTGKCHVHMKTQADKFTICVRFVGLWNIFLWFSKLSDIILYYCYFIKIYMIPTYGMYTFSSTMQSIVSYTKIESTNTFILITYKNHYRNRLTMIFKCLFSLKTKKKMCLKMFDKIILKFPQ